MGWDSDDSAWANRNARLAVATGGVAPQKLAAARSPTELLISSALRHYFTSKHVQASRTGFCQSPARRRVRMPLHVVREAAALYISQALLIHSPCVALERLVCADEHIPRC